jgi:hypothetical protein
MLKFRLRAGYTRPFLFWVKIAPYFGRRFDMPVPSLGFVAGPDVLKEETALAQKKVNSWSHSRKFSALAQGADRISQTLKSFPPALWKFKPSKEKWCVGEILWHLADQETNLYVRLRRAMAESGSSVSPYDQDKWSQELGYLSADFKEALEILKLIRHSNTVLLKRFLPSVWKRTVNHPERGLLTVDSLVAMNIWHLEHHLGQMLKRQREWKTGK